MSSLRARTVAQSLGALCVALATALSAAGAAIGQEAGALRARARAAMAAGDYATAFRSFMPLAQANDVEAQMAVAGFFAEGRGIQADQELAVAWYKAALVSAALAPRAAAPAAAAAAPKPIAARPAAAATSDEAPGRRSAPQVSPTGSWRADLATFRTAPEAQVQWQTLRLQHGDKLTQAVGAGRPQIMRDERTGTFVLQSGGYPTRDAAELTCARLQQLRLACTVAP